VQDIVTCLQFLRKVVPSFRGDASKITIAGQSSGANLIRAVLATPSASSLFQSAILHSDPMVSNLCAGGGLLVSNTSKDFGFLSISAQSKLQAYFNEQVNCSSTDTSCINTLSLSAILSASDMLFNNGVNIDPCATQEEPMRPVHDGTLITSTLDSTTPFPQVSKPLIVSNVKDEAGPAIYGLFTDPMSKSHYSAVVHASFEEPRATNILESPYYQVPVLADGQAADARVELEKMGSDQVWRCPTWTFARSWIRHGGDAFVAMYTVGATYPDNQGIPFCTRHGSVCHEDDIEIVVCHSNHWVCSLSLMKCSSAQSSILLQISCP
jgi:carboxylesterase type B